MLCGREFGKVAAFAVMACQSKRTPQQTAVSPHCCFLGKEDFVDKSAPLASYSNTQEWVLWHKGWILQRCCLSVYKELEHTVTSNDHKECLHQC